ncbi:MAG: sensor histidine kinase [Syntrophobacteraceae bacterium]
MSKKWAYITGASLFQAILICVSFYFLYTAPSVGIRTAWDKGLQRWKVTSAEPWSGLREGDLIESIDGLDIGRIHLIKTFFHLKDRKEVLAWYEALKDLYKRLEQKEVSFVVTRGSGQLSIALQPREERLSFLLPYAIEPFIGFVFFMIGAAALHRKGIDEQSLLLFLFCSCIALWSFANAESISPEMVVEPHFQFLRSIAMALFGSLAFMQMLHLSLLLPKRSIVLHRFPGLPWLMYPSLILLDASLYIKVMHLFVTFICTLAVLATCCSYFSCTNPVEKQQMKWVGVGYIFGLSPLVFLCMIPLILTGEVLVEPSFALIFTFLIPLCMAFAILRYRLMGIDDLLHGTIIYMATMGVLIGIDLSLMGIFGTRFGGHFDLAPGRRAMLAFAITISLYAALRERVRYFLRKLFGREPLDERDVLSAFTDAASGQSPDAIAKFLESSIRNTFMPKGLTLIGKGNGAGEELLSAFRGTSDPVLLWESPLKEKAPSADMLLALPLGRGPEAEYVLFSGELPGRKLYGSRELEIMRSLLRQAKLLYENAWLYEEEKRHLSEKEKIFRDLHDGIGGIMTNIGLLAEVARKSPPAAGGGGPLSTISRLSQEGMSEIRTIMHNIDSTDLTWGGLVSELRGLGARMIEPNGIAFEMESTLSAGRAKLGRFLYLNLLRICREALTNAIKHSGAGRVRVRTEMGPERIVLSIEDDGVGFGSKPSAGGRGLSNMEKRARDIGGALSVQSGDGTRVHLEVVTKQEGDVIEGNV